MVQKQTQKPNQMKHKVGEIKLRRKWASKQNSFKLAAENGNRRDACLINDGRVPSSVNARSPRDEQRVQGMSNIGASVERRRWCAFVSADTIKTVGEVRQRDIMRATDQRQTNTHGWNWILSETFCQQRSQGMKWHGLICVQQTKIQLQF